MAVVGLAAGIESTVLLERDDLLRAARAAALPAALLALLALRCRRRHRPPRS